MSGILCSVAPQKGEFLPANPGDHMAFRLHSLWTSEPPLSLCRDCSLPAGPQALEIQSPTQFPWQRPVFPLGCRENQDGISLIALSGYGDMQGALDAGPSQDPGVTAVRQVARHTASKEFPTVLTPAWSSACLALTLTVTRWQARGFLQTRIIYTPGLFSLSFLANSFCKSFLCVN